jgi:hypothetical protein
MSSKLLETAAEYGADMDAVRSLTIRCQNWTEFRESVEAFIGEEQKKQRDSVDGRPS